VTPPPAPRDPITVFVLRDALHTGLVLPPLRGGAPWVEFGFGDWSWYALGNDSWYHAFATVLWPTQATLSRREFRASTPEELQRAASWTHLLPVVVSRQRADELQRRLQQRFDTTGERVVQRPGWSMAFAPLDDDAYWLGHNCADLAGEWLEELGCRVSWVPIGFALACDG
jgi:hypothetical protein